MKTDDNLKIRTNTANQRSYLDQGSRTQIIRRGNGEIVMTEGELVSFFGTTWRKLNHRFQTIMISSNLCPEERVAGEEEVIINGPLKGCTPFYPLSIIIALSFLLNNTETHLFRKCICQKLQKPAFVITPIFLIGNMSS